MTPVKDETAMLCRVAAALMALLALTIGLSFVPLGPFNFAVAITIAVMKALLVALFFMELRHSSRVLWVLAAAGIFWLMLLMGGTMADVATRVSVMP